MIVDLRADPRVRAGTRGPSALASLRPLLAAAACALTAQRILLVAVPWLVLTETGSPAATGLVSAAQVTPILLAKLFGGPLLDRAGPARIVSYADGICAAGMLLLATASTPPLWLIVAIMAAVGAAQGPSAAAKTALLAGITRTVRRPMQWGTGLMTTVERSATTLGPAAGGLLIAMIGGQRLLWLVAALFAGASLFTRAYRHRTPRAAADRRYWSELRDGAKFLLRDRSLTALLTMYAVTNWLDEALIVTMLPLWARTGGHSPALIGAALSAAGATAVLTALLSAYGGHHWPRRSVYLIAAVVSGPTRFAVLAIGLPPAAVLAVFAISGLGSGLISPLADAVQLERIPADLRGRVFTLVRAAAWIGIPGGGATGAVLTGIAGLPAALWICAVGYLAAAVYPGWRVAWHPPPGERPAPASAITSPDVGLHRTTESSTSPRPDSQTQTTDRHSVPGRPLSTTWFPPTLTARGRP
jgi:MFS family permease